MDSSDWMIIKHEDGLGSSTTVVASIVKWKMLKIPYHFFSYDYQCHSSPLVGFEQISQKQI